MVHGHPLAGSSSHADRLNHGAEMLSTGNVALCLRRQQLSLPTLHLEALRCPEWPSARLYAFSSLALLPQVISQVLGPLGDLTLEESDVVL